MQWWLCWYLWEKFSFCNPILAKDAVLLEPTTHNTYGGQFSKKNNKKNPPLVTSRHTNTQKMCKCVLFVTFTKLHMTCMHMQGFISTSMFSHFICCIMLLFALQVFDSERNTNKEAKFQGERLTGEVEK